MNDPMVRFTEDAEFLRQCEALADYVALVSDEPAPLLMGAVIKTLDREYGGDGAVELATRWLQTLVRSREKPQPIH